MTGDIIHFADSEVYPIAEKRFIETCGFDLSTRKHQRMMAMGAKVREDGIEGLRPSAICRFLGPEHFHDGVLSVDQEEITCNYFTQIPEEKVKGIYIYMVTAGECYFSSEENIMDFLYADIWGTNYVDAVTDLLSARLQKDIRERFGSDSGYWLTPEFGPGYFGMSVRMTHRFYNILDGSKLGIRVKESGLMIPQKSVAGLFFVLEGDNLIVEPECLRCDGNKKGCNFCVVRSRQLAKKAENV